MATPTRKRLRIEGFDYSEGGYVFFATLCARHHVEVLSRPHIAVHIIDALQWSRAIGRWRVYCYCLMPDHLHLVIAPGDAEWDLSATVASFKSWTTRKAWEMGLHGQLWQRSWYDHVARRDEDVAGMCAYVLQNPVRRGLVTDPEAWPYLGTPDGIPV